MGEVKLTKAQRRLLADLAGNGPAYVDDNFPPIKKLRELGYVEAHNVKYGNHYSATPTGRDALTPGDGEGK